MQVAPAVEPGDAPSSLQLLGWGGGHWKASHGNVVFPAASRSLRQGKNGRFGGIRVGATVLAAVVAVTAVYLVLRCAVYLVNASKSRVALRFLAKAEETTRTEAGEPCTVQDDDQPEAAAGAAGAEREGEVLLVDDLLERARRYVTELETLLRVNTFVFTQLDNALKSMLVAEFLCLCLMEFSALYSLMERRERAGMQELISNIYIKIQSLGNRMNWRQLTPARRRHIQFLYSLFDRLSEVDPPTGAFEERQRLSRMKELLTLQEMALGQLDYGFSALRECVESGRKRSDDPKAGASPAKGAAAATQGAVAPPDVPEAPESVTVRSVFMAIERTAHKRRDQNLMDKHLSAWMRMKHYEKPHYSIMSTHRLLKATGQPMQTHKELLEDLQATPLGLRDVSVRATSGTGIYTDKTTASSSVQEEPSQEKKESPQDNHDSRALGPLERPSQHSPTGPGTEGPSPAAASPGTSTAAGGVPAAQSNQAAVQAPSHGETVPSYTAPNRPPQVSSPAAPGHLQGSAVSAAAEPVTVPSAGVHSPQALWTTNASTAAPVGRVSSPSSSDEALPRPPPSSFTAAVSSAAAYSPQSFTLRTPSTAAQPPSTSPAFDTPRASVPTEPLPTPSPSSSSAAVPSAAALAQEALTLSAPTAAAQPAVFSDPHFAPWVSPSSLSIWAPLSASHWSPAVSAPTQGGIDSSPLPSSALRGPPSLSSDGAAGAWPLRRRGVDEGAPPGTERVVSASSVSPWHRPPSQPLPPSPWLPTQYRSASGTAGQENSPEVDTWPFTSRVWGPLGTVPPRPPPGFSPIEGPDGRSHPGVATGLAQAAEFFSGAAPRYPPVTAAAWFSGTSGQQSGEATPPWHPPDRSNSRN